MDIVNVGSGNSYRLSSLRLQPEPMLSFCQFDHEEPNFTEIETKMQSILDVGGFVHTSMCQFSLIPIYVKLISYLTYDVDYYNSYPAIVQFRAYSSCRCAPQNSSCV